MDVKIGASMRANEFKLEVTESKWAHCIWSRDRRVGYMIFEFIDSVTFILKLHLFILV